MTAPRRRQWTRSEYRATIARGVPTRLYPLMVWLPELARDVAAARAWRVTRRILVTMAVLGYVSWLICGPPWGRY